MSKIIINEISKFIRLKESEEKAPQPYLTDDIGNQVFPERAKTWTRILNNTSQPTLEEAAHIAHILGKTIDDLFVFESLKTVIANKS